MSRRNNSTRRRNYGRRQHEVRERRPSAPGRADWNGPSATDDWSVTDPDNEQQSTGADDGYRGIQA